MRQMFCRFILSSMSGIRKMHFHYQSSIQNYIHIHKLLRNKLIYFMPLTLLLGISLFFSNNPYFVVSKLDFLSRWLLVALGVSSLVLSFLISLQNNFYFAKKKPNFVFMVFFT